MRTEINSEHPHIVKVPGVLGGEPIIAGTRMGVAFIARLLQAGEEPSEIIAVYPHLAPAVVYDAISYYLNHCEEIDELIGESTASPWLRHTASRSPSATQSYSRLREGPSEELRDLACMLACFDPSP
jgi:uncharacterized protein (DUF433 family)